jgi:putative acetyltransferase
MQIRIERAGDIPAVRVVNLTAFDTPAEADLVDALRAHADPAISLVAEDPNDGAIVGHIFFSPVTLGEGSPIRIAGLAPMAVVPARQRRGIGSTLVWRGLELCRQQGFVAAVVLGHPQYYPRFGFTPASRFGLRCDYDVPDDVFMALELEPGALAGQSGTIRYHPVFATF